MNIVIDTNVLFSALYRPSSVPGRLVELALEGELRLFAPETVRKELRRILQEKLSYSEEEWRFTERRLPIEWIQAAIYDAESNVARESIRDPDDAPIVATALVLGAVVVSGDGDFHPLDDPVVETYRPRDALDGMDV